MLFFLQFVDIHALIFADSVIGDFLKEEWIVSQAEELLYMVVLTAGFSHSVIVVADGD